MRAATRQWCPGINPICCTLCKVPGPKKMIIHWSVLVLPSSHYRPTSLHSRPIIAAAIAHIPGADHGRWDVIDDKMTPRTTLCVLYCRTLTKDVFKPVCGDMASFPCPTSALPACSSSWSVWFCRQLIFIYTHFFLQILTAVVVMRPIALVSVALAVSASALSRIVLGRDLGHNAGGEGLEKRRVNNGTNPQNTLSKRNESSLTSQRLYRRPSSVGSQGHLQQL